MKRPKPKPTCTDCGREVTRGPRCRACTFRARWADPVQRADIIARLRVAKDRTVAKYAELARARPPRYCGCGCGAVLTRRQRFYASRRCTRVATWSDPQMAARIAAATARGHAKRSARIAAGADEVVEVIETLEQRFESFRALPLRVRLAVQLLVGRLSKARYAQGYQAARNRYYSPSKDDPDALAPEVASN